MAASSFLLRQKKKKKKKNIIKLIKLIESDGTNGNGNFSIILRIAELAN